MYSAKKVRGNKLYELARKGLEIERKPTLVTIYKIEVVDSPLTADRLPLRIHCSSGTYIRSLAHDIGQALGCGAYLEELRRTDIGPFHVTDATLLADLTIQNILQKIQPPSAVLDIILQST